MTVPRLRNMTSLYLCSGENILLLYRRGSRVVNNVWIGSAGGHFENDELNDPKRCVLRELKEELGLDENDISDLELRYITLRVVKGEVRQNYYFFAKLNDAEKTELCSNEGQLRWYALSELDKVDMPYTSRYVIDHYLEKGRYDSELYAGTAAQSGMIFTALPQQ